MNVSSDPIPTDPMVTDALFKKYLITSNGDGFWLFCNRPIEEAATDMLRSAIRACKPVPSITNKARTHYQSTYYPHPTHP